MIHFMMQTLRLMLACTPEFTLALNHESILFPELALPLSSDRNPACGTGGFRGFLSSSHPLMNSARAGTPRL